jgi:hypothetical protein
MMSPQVLLYSNYSVEFAAVLVGKDSREVFRKMVATGNILPRTIVKIDRVIGW